MSIETRLAAVFPPTWEYCINEKEVLHFTECSKLWRYFSAHYDLPTAVQFAADRGSLLVSAQEQALFRIKAGTEDSADKYHLTRTAAIYFCDGEKYYVAFDDIPDRKKNIILAQAHDGDKKQGWILSKTDEYIRGILERAEHAQRIVELTDNAGETVEKAILGELTQPYRQAVNIMHVAHIPKMQLEYYLASGDDVELCVVGIGHTPMWDGEAITATSFYSRGGIARGIREKRNFIPGKIESVLTPNHLQEQNTPIPLPEKSSEGDFLRHSKRIKIIPGRKSEFLLKENHEYYGDYSEQELFRKIKSFPEEQHLLLIKDKNGKYHIFTQ